MSATGETQDLNFRPAADAVRIEHLNQLLLAMRDVGRILNTERDPVKLCQQICDSLGRTRGYVTVWIGRPDFAGNRVEPLAASGNEPNTFLNSPITLDDQPTAKGPVGTAVRERRLVVFDDLAGDPRFAPWRAGVLPSGARSMAAVPLIYRETVTGVLAVKASKVSAFDEEEKQLLQELGDDIARALHSLDEESALANTREHLETLVEAMPDAVFFKDGAGRWLVVNSTGKKLFQTDKRSWFGRTDAEMAGDLPTLQASHEACAVSDEAAWQAGRLTVGEETVELADGQTLVAEVYKQPLFHPDGRRKGLVAVARNITARKRQELELVRSRDFYLSLLENAPAMVWRACTDAKCDWFNASWLKFTGRRMEQEVGDGWAEGVHPEDLNRCVKLYLDSFHKREPFEMEYRLRRHDGKFRWITDSGVPFKNLDGSFGGYIGYCHDINDRRETDAALRRREEIFSGIVNLAGDAIALLDVGTGCFAEFNQTAHAMLGYSREDYESFGPKDIDAELTPEQLRLTIDEVIAMGGKVLETRHRHRDGRLLDVRVNMRHIRLQGRDYIAAIWSDITRQKQADEELRKSEAMFQNLFAQHQAIMAVVDPKSGMVRDANPAAVAFYGWPLDKIKRLKISDLSARPAEIQTAMMADLQKNGSSRFESTHRLAGGSQREVEVFVTAIEIHGEQLLYCIIFDITARKAAETSVVEYRRLLECNNESLEQCIAERTRELADSEEKFRSMAASANSAVFLTDQDGRVSFWNRAAEQIFGWPAGEIIGQPAVGLLFYEPILPDAQATEEAGQQHAASIELVGIRKNHDLFPVEVSLSMVKTRNGYQTVGIASDITSRKIAERKLQENEQKYRILFESSSDALVTCEGPSWRFNSANPAAMQLFQAQSMRELLDCEPWRLSPEFQPDGRRSDEKARAMIAKTLAEGSQYFEWMHRRLNGETFMASVKLSRMEGEGRVLVQGAVRDITEQKNYESSLRSKALEIEDLYNNAPCGYHSLDADGRFLRINDTELHWLGYARAELIGRKITELFAPQEQGLPAQSFLGITGENQAANFRATLVRKDGTHLPVMINSTAVRDADGKFLHTRTTVSDNSERVEAEKAMEASFRATVAANRAKTEFLANMSHEIRTPLNAILGYTQLLQEDESLNDTVKRQIAIIHRSGENLLGLLNSILEISKIEAGKIEVVPVAFEVEQFFEETLALYRERAAKKQLTIAYHKAIDVPNVLLADRDKIRQVLSNLLSNAIKFTDKGGIQVSASVLAAAGGDMLHIRIEDTGTGIAPGELAKLFEKFEQTESGRSSATGTGLGLAISRQLARAMGGDITAASELHNGSLFDFAIPCTPEKDTVFMQRKALQGKIRLAPGTGQPLVFVVDDVEENRHVVQRMLEQAGFAVQAFDHAGEMLALLETRRPDLVIMDTRMPGLDGYEATRRIKKTPAAAGVKILTLSASAYDHDRQESREAGADDFLAKPFHNHELLTKIGALLGLSFEKAAVKAGRSPDTEYLYPALKPENLESLPPALRQKLYDQILIADFESAGQSLRQVQAHDEKLVKRLLQLMDRFESDKLLELLQNDRTSPADE
jgi:PAS domain S-box-containing protein